MEMISGAWGVRVHETSEVEAPMTPCFSVRSLLEDVHSPRVDVLKVDIEGALS